MIAVYRGGGGGFCGGKGGGVGGDGDGGRLGAAGGRGGEMDGSILVKIADDGVTVTVAAPGALSWTPVFGAPEIVTVLATGDMTCGRNGIQKGQLQHQLMSLTYA